MRLEELRSPFGEHGDENFMGVGEIYSEPTSGKGRRLAVVLSLGNAGKRKVLLFVEREVSSVGWLRNVLKLVKDNDLIGITGDSKHSGISEVVYKSDVSVREKDDWIEVKSPTLGKKFTTENDRKGETLEI